MYLIELISYCSAQPYVYNPKTEVMVSFDDAQVSLHEQNIYIGPSE